MANSTKKVRFSREAEKGGPPERSVFLPENQRPVEFPEAVLRVDGGPG